MMHFTCDLCGQPLKDERFVVKIELYPAHDPHQLTEDDLDIDQLEAISEMLEGLEEDIDGEAEPVSQPQMLRYDLCKTCCQRYQADPLGRDVSARLNFSQN